MGCAQEHDAADGSAPLHVMFDTGDIVRFKILKRGPCKHLRWGGSMGRLPDGILGPLS